MAPPFGLYNAPLDQQAGMSGMKAAAASYALSVVSTESSSEEESLVANIMNGKLFLEYDSVEFGTSSPAI